MCELYVLQSGFVSASKENLRLPNNYDAFYTDSVLSKGYKHDSNLLYYSETISRLFREFSSDRSIVNKFLFREEVLKTIKSLIGIDNFYKWLLLQTTKAELTNLHKLFLYDTFNYLLSDGVENARTVEPVQWITLIQRRLEEETEHVVIDNFFDGSRDNLVQYLPSKVNNLIGHWCSKAGGFEDMLTTMYVIFGDRPYITDVARNPERQ